MKQNRTVLEKIGISHQIVKNWKSQGIKITYPMRERKNYMKSEDGVVFVESADKYVPPLTKKETKLYTKYPERFRDDFMKNVSLYFQFHTFLFDKAQLLENLKTPKEKLSSALSLMYLFLSAMDHHYYHYDRYLVYEDYPQTPLGYWWSQLKIYHSQVFNEKVSKTKPTENFLKLLSGDINTLSKFKTNLSKDDYKGLLQTLKSIKIFEDTQEKEIRIISGYPAKEDLLLKTGFGIWNQICDLIKNFPETVQKKSNKKITELIEGHPIISTRILLLPSKLKTFKGEIFSEFIKEINRWQN
jgi:hypothetical protein